VRKLSRTRLRPRLSGRTASANKLRRRFQPSHYLSGGNDSLWRMWINRSGSEPLTVDSDLSGKQLRVFLGLECFGSARISPGLVIRSNGVRHIPAVWFEHLLLLMGRCEAHRVEAAGRTLPPLSREDDQGSPLAVCLRQTRGSRKLLRGASQKAGQRENAACPHENCR
jgi:hypothetical protein